MSETWNPIKGYEDLYEVSSYGRVRSVERTLPHKTHGTWTLKSKLLKQKHNGAKYNFVFLHSGSGKQKPAKVHRLVADAFVPNKFNKPEVNHKDGNRQNNRADNLEWSTPKENTSHAWKSGLCDNIVNSNSKAVENILTGEIYESIRKAAKTHGVSERTIWRHAAGLTASETMQKWRYAR